MDDLEKTDRALIYAGTIAFIALLVLMGWWHWVDVIHHVKCPLLPK